MTAQERNDTLAIMRDLIDIMITAAREGYVDRISASEHIIMYTEYISKLVKEAS